MLQRGVNQRYRSSFRSGLLGPAISLAMIRKNLSTRRGELFPMLLKAGQHSEIALIQHPTTVPLDIARASSLLLFGSTVLRHGGTGKEKRKRAGDKDIFVHGDLFAQ
jgi:hypothetical protein